ncbi:MAG: response regulator transcription factor [Lachnospiraceae bacterium]|nr:response regulator transcription factor [Lachnospiraceae bacterium]
MIRIAVCDDESVMCRQLAQMISAKLKKWEEEFVITCYTSAVRLILSPLDFDMIFLDIQMPGINGVELAKKLRKKEFNGILIFVTVLTECMPDAFEVEAMDYLCKPVDEARLERTLLRSLKRLSLKEEKGFFVRAQNGYRMVKFSEVYYCEVMNRKIHLHMRQDVIEYYGKMKDLEQQTLPYLIRCHRSFLVNPVYLQEYKGGQVTLENGAQIPVSKSYHRIFMERMLHSIDG